jgi:hypothetical protein
MDSFDFIEKVEALFAGLLAFIRAFFVTLFDLALRPKRFAGAFSEPGLPYARPFSFLTLSTFSIVTVLRNLVTLTLVALIASLRGCSLVTELPAKEVSFLELLKLPSVETIVYVALPVVLFVVMIARFFDWAIARRKRDSAAKISSIFPYAVGFQFILIPVLVGAALLAFTYRTKENITEVFDSNKLILTLLGLPILAGVSWPCVSLFRVLGALRPPPPFRVERPAFRNLYVGLVCVACLSATFVASMGVALLFARQDIRRIVPNGPLLTASYVELIPVSPSNAAVAGMPRVSILIRNNADLDVWLLGDGVILSTRMDQPSMKAHIVNGRLQAGVVHLRPGEGMTIDFAIEGYGPHDKYGGRDGGSANNAAGHFFYQFDTPGNEEEMLVHFASVNADGTLGEINAVLLADKDRRAALEKKLAEILAVHP